MNKPDFREFISWRSAFHKAHRQLKATDKRQAVYHYMKGDKRYYKRTTYSLWKMMKPGTLVCIVQHRDPNLDGFFYHYKMNGRLL